MNRWQQLVKDFHEATDSTVGLTAGLRDHELRAKLIMEEAVETVSAMGYEVHSVIWNGGDESEVEPVAIFDKHFSEPDFEEAIDGLCDLIYVIAGSAVAWGIDLDPHFTAVQNANMMKLQGPKRADGKQLKPEGWQPPDHARVLAETQSGELPWNSLSPSRPPISPRPRHERAY